MANVNPHGLDELDFAILAHLQVDGRKSFTDIAKALNVAGNTVRNRVTRMIEQGTLNVIGRVNPHHVGFHAYAMIHVTIEPPHLTEAAVAQIIEFPEVSFLATMSGEYDLCVDVMCRDNQHFTELINQRLHQVPGVTKTKTMFFLKAYKYGQPDLSLLQTQQAQDTKLAGARPPANDNSHALPYR